MASASRITDRAGHLKPRDAKDVEDAVVWALAEGKTLEIAGRGSKRSLGRPSQSDLTLDLSGLSGVTLYEPEELVLSARAGTPIAEIEKLVAESGQELAFEPADYGPLLGGAPGAGSIGGVLATNLSGPRRLKAGAARDHFLGFTAVSGRGETFKSGGRVVKNVTGYDLCKLMAGSFGTLGAMTDVTIKTLPRAETEATLLVTGLDGRAGHPRDGGRHGLVLRRVRRGASAGRDRRFGCRSGWRAIRDPVSARRREAVGLASQRDARGRAQGLRRGAGACRRKPPRDLWRAIRDVTPFADGMARAPVWRISTAPMQGAALAAGIAQAAAAAPGSSTGPAD